MYDCGGIFGFLREAVFVVVRGDADAYRDCCWILGEGETGLNRGWFNGFSMFLGLKGPWSSLLRRTYDESGVARLGFSAGLLT